MATDSQDLDAALSAPGSGLDSLAFACTVIVVADLDRSSQWYQSILGFTEHARVRIDGANVVLLEGAGTQLELIEGDGPTVSTEPSLCADPPHHLLPKGNKFLAFAVKDLRRATDQLREKGVQIIWRDKQLAPGIRSTAIRDVEDNFIHIVQH
jgi:catechol 2,3-dioxygenase-like lactoylglutathione lyase family enzyme